jgi:hypothetical protein
MLNVSLGLNVSLRDSSNVLWYDCWSLKMCIYIYQVYDKYRANSDETS